MIYWDSLLQVDPEHVSETLTSLYVHMSIAALAIHLGVGRQTLRLKLLACNIKLRPRGGSHVRFPREDLPDLIEYTPKQIAEMTGYTVNYARKLRGKYKENKNETIQVRKR